MGAVYEAEHLHTGQRVALKVLTRQPGASAERFKREARAVARVNSDHIVRVTDADVATELDGVPFLVMELLDGADLETTTGDTPAAPADAIDWLRQVSRGLTKAHDAGIVHRDLKPENLFLTRREDGTPLVKILDFGIAKTANEATALTASDAFLGTPSYMAPEQTDSRGPPITHRADLFALGLIAFKLLVGRTYWRQGGLPQMLAQILAEPMPPASERGSTFGAAFDAWFRRACNRDPELRFASAADQIDALAIVLEQPANVRASDPAGFADTLSAAKGDGSQASGSLKASTRDLATAKRMVARRRIVGTGVVLAAVVVVGGAAVAWRRPVERAPSAVAARPVLVSAPAAPMPPYDVAKSASPAPEAPSPSTSAVIVDRPPARMAPPPTKAVASSPSSSSSAKRAAPTPAGRATATASARPPDPTEGAF
jgi:serine/threonine-protein kinase